MEKGEADNGAPADWDGFVDWEVSTRANERDPPSNVVKGEAEAIVRQHLEDVPEYERIRETLMPDDDTVRRYEELRTELRRGIAAALNVEEEYEELRALEREIIDDLSDRLREVE